MGRQILNPRTARGFPPLTLLAAESEQPLVSSTVGYRAGLGDRRLVRRLQLWTVSLQ